MPQAKKLPSIHKKHNLGLPANRLLTFKKHKWVFGEEVRCSPTSLSLAGFYAITSDCAICYFCQKELEGWDPNDIPWNEHKTHSPECPFIKYYSSPPVEVLVLDSVKLEKERMLYIVRKAHEQTMEAVEGANKKPGTAAGRKKK